MSWTPPWTEGGPRTLIFIADAGLYDMPGKGDPDELPLPSAGAMRDTRSYLRQSLMDALRSSKIGRGALIVLSARTKGKDRVIRALREIGVSAKKNPRVVIRFRLDPDEPYDEWYMRAAVEAARVAVADPTQPIVEVYGHRTNGVRAALKHAGFEVR